MNDELVEKFNNQTFTQGSAILKIKYYNPKKLIVQHLPIEERENKIENNRMRKRFILEHLTTVEIQKTVKKIGGKVIEIYVFYEKKFETSPFRNVIDKLFA